MQARKFVVPILVGLACCAAGCGRQPHVLVGQEAPNLRLNTLDGGRFDLAEHEGKNIVLLDFWATWCSPCRVSMPLIAEAVTDYEEKGVVFHTVNMGDSPEEIRRFLGSVNLDVPVALDPAMEAAVKYSVEFIPQTVLIDKEGRVQAVHVGAPYNPDKRLRRELDWLLAGKSLVERDEAPPT